MNKMENVPTWEQIKKEIRIGDYDLVAEMIGITRDAAKMRLRRKSPEALEALNTVIKNRKDLIEGYQSQNTES